MIKLVTPNGDGNVQVGVKPIHVNEGRPTGYSVVAYYNGTRGNREEIDNALKGLWQEGKFNANGNIDPTSEARLLSDIISRVDRLEETKGFGLVVNEIDADRNGETAKILESNLGIRMTDEGLITKETTKDFVTTLEPMRNT